MARYLLKIIYYDKRNIMRNTNLNSKMNNIEQLTNKMVNNTEQKEREFCVTVHTGVRIQCKWY